VLDRVIRVTSIAAMEAYSAPVGDVFSLNAGGRSGTFDVVAGDFSAELAADTLNGIYIGLADDPTATTKVAKRSMVGVVTPMAFGAEENASPQEEILESFFSWVSSSEGYSFSAGGEYIISRGVVMPSLSGKTFSAGRFILKPTANTYINDDALQLQYFENSYIPYIGIRSNFSGSGFRNGVVAGRIRRTQVDKIEVEDCRLFGTVISSTAGFPANANNNTWTILEQRLENCGEYQGVDIAFTETARDYRPNNENQTSTLSIDLDDYYPTYAKGTPFEFDGQLFVVLLYDKIAQEAIVYPCLGSGETPDKSGVLKLIPGGGMLTVGADSGQGRTLQLNSRFCGCAVFLQAAYGGSITGITSQFNGIDIVFGNPPASVSNAGETIYNFYGEAETFANSLQISQNASLEVIGTMSSFSKAKKLGPTPNPRVQYGVATGLIVSGKSGETGLNYLGPPACVSWRRSTGQNVSTPDISTIPSVIAAADNGNRDYGFDLSLENVNTSAFGLRGLDMTWTKFFTTNTISITVPVGFTIEGTGTNEVTLTGLPPAFRLICGQTLSGNYSVFIIELTSATSYVVV